MKTRFKATLAAFLVAISPLGAFAADEAYDAGEVQISAQGEQSEVITWTPESTNIDPETYQGTGSPSNIADLLQDLPIIDFRGMTDLVPDDDVLYMRGFSSKRFVTSIDGVTVRKTGGRRSSHIVDYALLPTWMIDEIEVLPGPHSALYPGKGIGGTVNLVTKKPVIHDSYRPDVDVSASYGSYDTQNHNIKIGGGARNFVYDLGYQKYHTDGFLRHTNADIDTVFGRLGYVFDNGGHVSLSASTSDADRDITIVNDPDDAVSNYDDDHPVVKAGKWLTYYEWQDPSWDKEATSYRFDLAVPAGQNTIRAAAYYGEENRDMSYLTWKDRNDHSAGTTDGSWETLWNQRGGKIEDEIRFSDEHITTVGVALEQCFDGYEGARESKKRIELISGYAQHAWQIVPALNLKAGLRYEDTKIWVGNYSSTRDTYMITGKPAWIERDWQQFIPKTFLTYELDGLAPWLRDTSVSTGVSRIWHAPDYHGDYNPQGRPAGAWLDPEQGIGYDLILSRRLVRDISLKVDLSYYDIDDFIATNRKYAQYTPSKSNPVTPGTEYYDYKINLDRVVQKGAEIQLGGHITDDLSFYTGYAYLDFESKGGEPAGETECDSRARYRLNAGLRYKPFSSTTLMLDYRYQDDQITQNANEIAPDVWSFYETEIDSYDLFDIAVEQVIFDEFKFARDGKVKVYVKNLLDEEYETSAGYPATDRTAGINVRFGF